MRLIGKMFIVLFFMFSAFLLNTSVPMYAQGFTEVYGGSLLGLDISSSAWGDYDNDGDLDILLTGGNNSIVYSKIYQNTGGGFTEVFAGSLTPVYDGSVAWGDYDNDGDLDILLTGNLHFGRVSKIYQNTGTGFSEVFAGTLSQISDGSVAWGDYNNDGYLDILLTGYDGVSGVSKIYRNTGNGFTEVFAGSLQGVYSGSVAWGDYNNDGDLDILLTGFNGSIGISKIYQNTGSGFSEVFSGSLTGVANSSVAWGDYDNDGDLDILMSGYSPGYFSKIYQNTGSGFAEVYAGSLNNVAEGAVAWGDYDNDGDLDVLLSGHNDSSPYNSHIYQNTGSGFTEVFAGTLVPVTSSDVSWGDYDSDGDLDILLTGYNGSNEISKIYRNNGTTFNSPPTAPAGLSATTSGSDATLQWSPATDAQTPQNGLNYNLRIGTSTGAINTQSPMANVSNGHRRVVQLGSVNQNTSWTVKNLPDGTYYWSVQAVDNAYAGSTFAIEDTFTIGAQQLSIVNTSPMEIAGCGGVGTLEPDSTISPSSHFGIPAEFVIYGEPNTDVIVSFILPAGLGCPDGETISASFSSTSGKNQITGLLFNPGIPNTFTLDSTGEVRITLGMGFNAGSGCTCPESHGQIVTTVQYSGGFSKILSRGPNVLSTGSDITFTCTGCGACISPPDSMVAWWSGDTTAADFSNQNNNGTLFNGVSYTIGKISDAYTFDGNNDYIEIPNSPSLNFGTGDFSFDAWIKTTSTSGVFVIQDKRAVSGGAGYHVHLFNGGPSIQIADATGFTTFNSNYSIADGQWHHVAVTVERASTTGLKFYVDGKVVSTKDPTGRSGSVSNNSVLRIGSRSFTLSGFFNGSLDEIEFFNTALTPVQVYSLFVADSVGKCKPVTSIALHGGVDSVRCGTYVVRYDPNLGSGNVIPTNNGESLAGNLGVNISGSVGASVSVTASFPNTLIGTCGTIATIAFPSYGPNSGVHIETGGYFNPLISNTFLLNNSGLASLRVGYVFVIPASASFLGETFTGQVTFMVDGTPVVSTITIVSAPGGCGMCITPPQGMVAWWSGDGTANDISIGTNDGVLMNGVSYSTGKVGQTFTFDGVDDYVEIPDNSSLNFGTGDFSIDAWVKTTSTSGVFVIQDKRESQGGAGYHMHLYNGGPSIQIGDATDYTTFNSNYSIADGQWHHVAITLERTNPAGLKFYVDGIVVSTKNPTARNGSISNNAVFRIGSRSYEVSGNFIGSIDEVEVFNRALTACQVNALFLADTLGKCKPNAGNASAGGFVTKGGNLFASGLQKHSSIFSRLRRGEPIRGVEVSIKKIPSSPIVAQKTETDSIGFYSFSNVEPGEYEISIVPPAGGTVALPPDTTYNFTLSGEDSLSNLDFEVLFTPPDSGWRIISSGTSLDLYAVGFFNQDTAIALADSGTILRTLDGGITWAVVFSDTLFSRSIMMRGGGDPLKGLDISKPKGGGGGGNPCDKKGKGICVGGGGKILKTTDYGATWLNKNSGTFAGLRGITSNAEDNYVAVGENATLIYSSDGGESWLPSTIISSPFGVFSNMGTTITVPFEEKDKYYKEGKPCLSKMNYESVDTASSSLIAVGENGMILKSTDQGVTWVFPAPFTGQALHAGTGFDGHYAFVAGDSTFLQSLDGGVTWNQMIDVGSTIRSVTIVDGQSGYAVGDDGRILYTPDKGTTWGMEFSPTSNNLFGVTSAPFENNYARTILVVGERGLIMRKVERISESVSVEATDGWNLLSLPVEPFNNEKDSLFRFSTGPAFGYNNGYFAAESLLTGKGYWMKFSGASTAGILGTVVSVETVDVQDKWNLVGSISAEISTASISSIPPGLITSMFFAYENGGYTAPGVIKPGKGYWVKVNGSGKLIFSSSEAAPASRIRIMPTDELPPPPPGNDGISLGVPGKYSLEQNYPNPFNPATVIRYDLPVQSVVMLKVFNLLGQEVKRLVDNQIQESGYRTASFDAGNLPSGVYFYRLTAQSEGKTFTDVKKMMLVK